MTQRWQEALKPLCRHPGAPLCPACLVTWHQACKEVERLKRDSVRGPGQALHPDMTAIRKEVSRWT